MHSMINLGCAVLEPHTYKAVDQLFTRLLFPVLAFETMATSQSKSQTRTKRLFSCLHAFSSPVLAVEMMATSQKKSLTSVIIGTSNIFTSNLLACIIRG